MKIELLEPFEIISGNKDAECNCNNIIGGIYNTHEVVNLYRKTFKFNLNREDKLIEQDMFYRILAYIFSHKEDINIMRFNLSKDKLSEAVDKYSVDKYTLEEASFNLCAANLQIYANKQEVPLDMTIYFEYLKFLNSVNSDNSIVETNILYENFKLTYKDPFGLNKEVSEISMNMIKKSEQFKSILVENQFIG